MIDFLRDIACSVGRRNEISILQLFSGGLHVPKICLLPRAALQSLARKRGQTLLPTSGFDERSNARQFFEEDA
jgi:hypothetical protein